MGQQLCQNNGIILYILTYFHITGVLLYHALDCNDDDVKTVEECNITSLSSHCMSVGNNTKLARDNHLCIFYTA